jgi:hypothetical protein
LCPNGRCDIAVGGVWRCGGHPRRRSSICVAPRPATPRFPDSPATRSVADAEEAWAGGGTHSPERSARGRVGCIFQHHGQNKADYHGGAGWSGAQGVDARSTPSPAPSMIGDEDLG